MRNFFTKRILTMTVLAMVSVALTNCAMDEDQSMPATSVKPKVTMDQVEAKIA